MGQGVGKVQEVDARIDETIVKSRRRSKMGSQFEDWSIEDVQETLGRFDKYKTFKFTGLESTRTGLLTQWPEFYDVMEHMFRKKAREELVKARNAMHPACRNYAMQQNPESRFPPPLPIARGEDNDDGDSKDRESEDEDEEKFVDMDDDDTDAENAGSADELSSNLSDDSDDDNGRKADAATKKKKAKKTKKKQKKKKKKKAEGDSEEEEGDGSDGASESDDSGSGSGSSSGSGSGSGSGSDADSEDADDDMDNIEADLEEEVRRKYNDKTPLRGDWDVRARSPMFFGYTSFSAKEEDNAEISTRDREKEEEKVDAASAQAEELEELLEEISNEMEGINGRREARRKKRDKELATRERNRKRREKEKNEAEKMYDPGEFRSYEVTWQAEEDDILDREAVEDAKYEIKADEQDTKWVAIETRLKEKEHALREETRLLQSRPRGEKFVKRSRKSMETYQKELGKNKRDLVEAERDLKLTEEELQRLENDPKTKPGQLSLQRSLMIASETKLEQAQTKLKKTLVNIDSMAARLQRAQRLKAREDRFIPIYISLVDPHSPAGDLNCLDATLMMAMNSNATIQQKVLFAFHAFDFFKRRALTFDAVVALISTVIRTLERAGEGVGEDEEQIEARRVMTGGKIGTNAKPRPKFTDQEVDNLVMRAFIEMDVPFKKLLTLHDFTKWSTELITRHEDLADAFRVNWKFATLSDFERKAMAPVHKFRQKMITLPELQYLVAKATLRFRPQLMLKQRRLIHERSMSMGDDDPTKPDYSKYMPKAKGQYFDTKMRPLRHGRLHNRQWYVEQIEALWATKLQAQWRARLGRVSADVEAKRQAFYAAKELARADAETKVRAEYDGLESLAEGSMKRLKWDAKVRMQQVKLRTKGLSLNREETVRYMVDKNVDKALRKVEKGFQQMEKESGFQMTDREKRIQHEADKLRLAYLSSLKDTGAPKGEDGEGSGTNGVSRGLNEQLSGEAQRQELVSAEASRQRERRRALVNCTYDERPELFDVGETSKERRLRVLLSSSNPTQSALLKHLTAMHRDLTQKRVSEILQEFPSKRLLLQYVARFKNEGALGWHLHDHFSLLYRDVVGIAKALMNLRRADYETGRVEGRIRMLLNEHQHALEQVASLDADIAKTALDKIDKRRLGAAKSELNRRKQRERVTNDDDNDDDREIEETDEQAEERIAQEKEDAKNQDTAQLQVLVEKDEEELGEAEFAYVETQKELNEAKVRTQEALAQVERLKKRLQDREHIVEITSNDRTAWNRRLTHCHTLPEANDQEIFAKYSEMAALFHDFKHCAQVYAKTIVNELFLEGKSLQPCSWEETDQKNGENTMLQRPRGLLTHDRRKKRPKWVVSNIRFKVAQDEHGVYNGDTDAAAKAFGADLRHSIAYIKCYVPNLVVPMMCLVDYRGYRVQCTAIVPLQVKRVDEMGEVRSVSERLVLGSRDRGVHIFNDDSDLKEKMLVACQRLNLAEHTVKGADDLIAKTITVGTDMRGYLGADERHYLTSFRRAFPPEHPKCTPHLRPETRDMSIFWRFLRPQFVKRNPSPLSPDALTLYTQDMTDSDQHDRNVEAATRRLVNELIPEYAEEISRRTKAHVGKMDITFEMHRLGMNLRHMGLLRGHFWFQIPGLVSLDFNSKYVKTTEDTTADIDVGSKLLVRVLKDAELLSKGETPLQKKQRLKREARRKHHDAKNNPGGSLDKNQGGEMKEMLLADDEADEDEDLDNADPDTYTEELYSLSTREKDRFSPKYLTMTEKVKRISVRGCKALTGIVANRDNSRVVRDVILLEMTLRSFKGLLRLYMRGCTRVYGVTSEQPLRVLCQQFLNMITGAHPRSEDMWNEELLVQMESRFGIRCLSTLEKQNLSRHVRKIKYPKGAWPKTIVRLCEMVGITLTTHCMEKLVEEPRMFTFSLSDLQVVGPRIKHNLNLLDFSEAQLLSVRARRAQGLTYEQTLRSGKGGGPILHLRLSERLASRIAFNLGTGGMGMSGYYSRTVVFEIETPIMNDFPKRGVRFDAGRQARVDIKYHRELSPFDPTRPFSCTVWMKLMEDPADDGPPPEDAAEAAKQASSGSNLTGEGTKRVVLQTGRYTLMVTKDDVLVFSIFCVEWGTDIVLEGPRLNRATGQWHHVAMTYDGAVGRLYVDGWEVSNADVQERALKDTLGGAESRKEASLKMEADEHKAKEEAKQIARETTLTWLNSDKQGKRYLQSRIRNAIEKSVYKLKMTKNAEELGLRKLSQKEATKVATKECQEEKADAAAVEVQNEFIRKKEEQGQIFQKMQEENQRREYWPLRIGASCPTARHKSGSNWFVGELCHVAVWEISLEKQRVMEHFVCGHRDQSQEATRLFDLAAEKFESALEFSYDDESVLNRYAETLCQHAGYGASTSSAEDAAGELADYNAKVRKAIAMFRRTENCDGVRALMGKLPQDDTYADLLCDAFRAIEDMDADYLREYVDFIAPLPAAFSLVELRPEYVGRIPNQKARVAVASDMYKLVVSEKPNFFSRLIDLEWLSSEEVQTASLIVYIINEVRQGADLRTVDLSRCSDATPTEIELFSDHVRDVYTLILKSCTVHDSTMALIGKRCRYLRELDLTGCDMLTDVAMESIGDHCKELRRLSLEGCAKVTDEGINDIARHCKSLTALNMNRCQFITDESLTCVGEACQSLKELKLSWMQGITDRGIYTFSSYANVEEMELLDLR